MTEAQFNEAKSMCEEIGVPFTLWRLHVTLTRDDAIAALYALQQYLLKHSPGLAEQMENDKEREGFKFYLKAQKDLEKIIEAKL